MQLEISLLKLPKGTGCTLVPSKEAIQSGFYDLKDVKLVLEQSLIRTSSAQSPGITGLPTVVDAIQKAGGLTLEADITNIFIYRNFKYINIYIYM